jgi:gliding motility-associated lipoprotein GldJ
MVMKTKNYKKIGFFLATILLIGSCAKEKSTATGWEYNNYENGGFEKDGNFPAKEQETGPGLVFIEGGTFTMGSTEEDVMDDWNNSASRVTVSSFYMDRTEVTNQHWNEYMYWMKRVYNKSYPHIYKKCLPDTLVWRSPLSYREKFVEYYLRHPSYRDYPVVGVSWLQANDFCKWRTDRVNEAILVREGIIKWHFAEGLEVGAANTKKYRDGDYNSSPENMFSTENYLNGNYIVHTGIMGLDKKQEPTGKIEGGYTLDNGTKVSPKDSIGRNIPRDPYKLINFDPVYANGAKLGDRPVKMEDGVLLPKYRLPSEAEWEFAALGLIGNLDPNSENIDSRRIYPWDGHYVRRKEDQWAGAIQANFVRGKGDYMGVSGALNDGADATAKVDDFWPNDYGLYHMAGNVSEWVMDVYRPTSGEVTEEFMPFRGNVYTTQLLRPDGLHDKPVQATDNLYDVYGMKEFVNEFARAKYLSLTGGKNEVKSLEKKEDPSYISNYLNDKDEDNKYLQFTIIPTNKMSNGPSKVNGNTLVFIQDTVTLTMSKADKIVRPESGKTYNYDWKIGAGATEIAKINSDSVVTLFYNEAGEYEVTLMQPNGLAEKKMIKVFDNQKSYDDYINYINSQRGQVLGNSRQDPRKFKFNTPKDSYIYSNSKYSKNDSIEFSVLDDINAVLDTAIYLYNKGNATKASHYLEVALFGNQHNKTKLAIEDYRKGHFDGKDYEDPQPVAKDDNGQDKNIESAANFGNIGIYYMIANRDYDNGGEIEDFNLYSSSIFKDDYLEYRFKDYKQDPNVTSWILTLRNGLSEFVNETRGQQRFRNVTEDENAGRLNYRKDDYINYLDGDLESSIYYNNQNTINDINDGKRNPKMSVYQSEFENYDLQGAPINDGSSGWPTTLISDKSRVYKGGSWKDRAYWLSPGNRRFLDEDNSTALIGFRCAMDRLGSSRANSKKKKK